MRARRLAGRRDERLADDLELTSSAPWPRLTWAQRASGATSGTAGRPLAPVAAGKPIRRPTRFVRPLINWPLELSGGRTGPKVVRAGGQKLTKFVPNSGASSRRSFNLNIWHAAGRPLSPTVTFSGAPIRRRDSARAAETRTLTHTTGRRHLTSQRAGQASSLASWRQAARWPRPTRPKAPDRQRGNATKAK